MTEDKIKSEEGAALWRRLRQDAAPLAELERPGEALLAAYLDGRLTEAEAAGLEARLAGDTELLDELQTLRQSLTAAPEAAPAGLVERARALRGDPVGARPARVRSTGWLDRLFGDWLRPAVPAFAALALVVACAGAFEMGRYQFEQLEATEPAAAGESDVPVDLLLGGFI